MDINTLLKYASADSTVILYVIGDTKIEGTIIDHDETSIVLQTQNGIDCIEISQIARYQISQRDTINHSLGISSSTTSEKPETQLLQEPDSSISSKTTEQSVVSEFESPHSDNDLDAKSKDNVHQSLPTPKLYDNELIKIHFLGKPHIEFPQPVYDFKVSSIKKLLDGCKSIFDNAQKIREWGRLRPCIEELEKRASSVHSLKVRGHLLYLAGIFAYYSGDDAKSYDLLKESFETCYCIESAYPLAALSIKKEKYENACNYLAMAIKEDNGKNEDLIRTLGQCVMQLPMPVHVRIGAIVDSETLPQEISEMAWMLLYYLLQDDPDACNAIEKKDVGLLRQCKSGNDLFQWEWENRSNNDESSEVDTEDYPTQIKHQGRISAFYSDRRMGFLIEAQTRQTWYFKFDSISDVSLIKSLSDGYLHQEVTFEEKENFYGKYPAACAIHLLSTDTDYSTVDSKPSLEVRLKALTKNSSFFAKAKTSEQFGDLEKAEQYYEQEIQRGPQSDYFKSAVKDLASLHNRNNKPLDAINLLDKYLDSFESREIRSINQMKVTFFLKAKDYEKAAQLLKSLAKDLNWNNKKKISYLQQEAYCYFAMHNYDIAIDKLEKILKFTNNEFVVTFLEKVKTVKETGETPAQNDIAEIFEDHISSPLAVLKLDACKFEGVDERSEYYTEEDIKRVLRLEKNVFGVRPVERSKYFLTAAKISQELYKPISETKRYLLEYFVLMAEAAVYDYLEIPFDVARCYAIEALSLGYAESKPQTIQKAWTILLSTYHSDDMPLPKDLLEKHEDNMLRKEVHILFQNAKSWTSFVKDYPFISQKTRRVIPALKEAIENVGGKLPDLQYDVQQDLPRLMVEKLFSRFNDFDSLVTDRFNTIRKDFLNSTQYIELLPQIDKTRIYILTRMLDDLAKYSAYHAFSSKDSLYHQLKEELEKQIEDFLKKPTTLTIEKMYPVFIKFQELLDSDYNSIITQLPSLHLTSVLDYYSVEQDGKVSVKLQLESSDVSAPPIEAIRFFSDDQKHEYDDTFYDEPFGFGKKEFEFRFRPTEIEKTEGILSLPVSLQYRSRITDKEIAGPFNLSIRLEAPMTEEEIIENPYLKYAGGVPIDENDSKMFFGRDALVKEISDQLSQKYSGQCFVLYGQKRSGKSSVLRQVGANISHDIVYTYLSAQSFNYDVKNALFVFVKMLVYELKKVLKNKHSIELPSQFLNFDDNAPILLLMNIKDFLEQRDLGWIVAIDEFTYLYSDEKEDLERFMHAWKAMLENKLFNALIIGQDTMPAFKSEYPNDFCVTHDKRITYLEEDSVYKMASDPILKDGESRFKGEALKQVYNLTAGNPYFLQQMCSEIVKYMNNKKYPFITGADIDNILDTMIRGDKRLKKEAFDSLVTAGDKKMAKIPEKILWDILYAIADPSNNPTSGWCKIDNLSSIPQYQEAIDDLVNRDSLERDNGQVRIRVALFSHWLRINK